MDRVIIDVREPFEFYMGHVKGALNIPPSELMNGANSLEGISRDTEIVLYRRTGSRSNVAMHILNELGYTNLINGINKERVQAQYGVREV
jgi:phage shock protein E